MSLFDYSRAQRVSHRQIAKFGGGENNARLDRSGVLRMCTVVLVEYKPQERDGNLIQFTDRRALVSPIGLTIDPDNELDVLVTGKFVAGVWQQLERLRIVVPPGKLAPAGTVIYWELQVRK